MARRLRSALEIVSTIGAQAFDLQHHTDGNIAAAVALLRSVNGPMFDWLVSVLAVDGNQQPKVNANEPT